MDNLKEVKLGDLAYEVSERVANPSESGYEKFVGLEHLDSGSLYVNRWGSTSDVKSAMKLFKKGDILFARRNTYLKRASIADFDGVCSGDIIVLREYDTTVKAITLLIMNLDKFWDFAISNSAGTMSKRAKWRDICEFKVNIFNEEKYIVNTILKIEASITKKQILLNSIRDYKQKLLDYYFQNNIKEDKYSDKSVKCGEKELGKICIGKGEYGIGATAVDYVEGPRYLRISDIDEYGNLLNDDLKGIDVEYDNRYILEDGDIVFARTGNTTGKSYLYTEKDGNLVYAGFLIRFKINKKIANPKFIKYFTETKTYWRWVNKISRRSGQPGINSSEYSKLNIPIFEMTKQNDIVKIFEDIDKTIYDTEKSIEYSRKVRQGILCDLIK